MLDSADQHTIASLGILRRTVVSGRPIVIWLGAGVSKWAGLPSWKDLSRLLMRQFSRQTACFAYSDAKAAHAAGDFPRVFQLCRDCDQGLYHSLLVSELRVDSVPNLYISFIRKLETIAPLFLVTTNADSLLEQNLKSINVIERTDLERFTDLCQTRTECLAKLHGSVSSVDTLVFTSDDYQKIRADSLYSRHVQEIFSFCSVLFLGYGVRDRYVLDSLAIDRDLNPLFGAGPHFLVTSAEETPHPSIHAIRYTTDRHGDHRGAMTVLDYMAQSISICDAKSNIKAVEPQGRNSALYITDFHPPGQYNTSQTVQAVRDDGFKTEMTVGLGWAAGELPNTESHALHDLLVGLLCFDLTYIPLDALGACVSTLGDELVRQLLLSGCLRFIHREEEPAIVTPDQEVIGGLCMVIPKSDDRVTPQEVQTLIRRYITAAPDQRENYEAFVELVCSRVTVIQSSDPSVVPNMTRSALLMPQVSRLLGFGEALLPSHAPKWLRFPLLRLAHIVQTAQVCQQLGIASTRLPFGGASLISAGFGIDANDMFVDHYASYVVSGMLKVNLEAYVGSNPRVLLNVLSFRETQAGIELRTHVFGALRSEQETEFGSAVDAGLKKAIPPGVLENARRGLQGLHWANGTLVGTPAVWTNPTFDDSSTRVWRGFARESFLKLLRDRGGRNSGACLCGSEDPASKCCLEALRT